MNYFGWFSDGVMTFLTAGKSIFPTPYTDLNWALPKFWWKCGPVLFLPASLTICPHGELGWKENSAWLVFEKWIIYFCLPKKKSDRIMLRKTKQKQFQTKKFARAIKLVCVCVCVCVVCPCACVWVLMSARKRKRKDIDSRMRWEAFKYTILENLSSRSFLIIELRVES